MRKLGLSLIFVVVMGVISLGWGISFYYSSYTGTEINKDDPIIQTYQQLGKTLALTLPSKDEQGTFIRAWGDNNKLSLSLIDDTDLALPDALTSYLTSGEAVILESDRHLSFYFLVANTNKILVLETEKPPVDEQGSLRLLLTLSFYLGVIALVLLWLYPLIQRLQKMRKTAIEFGSGNLSARLNLSHYSYISDIEREFNRMAERVRSLVDDNKLLSRAVSHDLKTPLARLRFGFETLEEAQSDDQREKYHKRIESDLNDMETLVETLLTYARMEEASISIEKTPIDLAALIENIAEKCNRRDIISIESTGDCTVFGDKKYLLMLAHNLLTNAIEHCDCRVLVCLEPGAGEVSLTVEDDGIGVPTNERARVIKPFERGCELKNTGRKGHGMGLAIVHRIAEWHNTHLIIADSAKLQGACFSVVFPANKSS